MTLIDRERTNNWVRAKRAAQAILYGPEPVRLARDMLYRLRIDIAAGVPREALLERIDDELYKLGKK